MRYVEFELLYQGKNITADICRDVLSVSFTEHADRKSDSASITLADRDRKWQGKWAPTHGDKFSLKLTCFNWFTEGDNISLDCGSFEVDEDELSSTPQGDVVTIRGLPVLVSKSLMAQRQTRSWEGASLERVARDIASESGLRLAYRGADIQLQRVDQRQESDIAFIQRLATEHGYRLKLSDTTLVIFEGALEKSLQPAELSRQAGDSFRGRRAKTEVYQSVVISYNDPLTGKITRYEYSPPDAPATGKVLHLNHRVEDRAQAERMAKAALRDKNKEQQTASWSGIGNPVSRAGGTINVMGWNCYDGIYLIERATHQLSGGGKYTTSLEMKWAQEF